CGVSPTRHAAFYWGETCINCGVPSNYSGACNRQGNPNSVGSPPMFYGGITTIPQLKPSPDNCNPCLLQTMSPGGVLVGLGDGSVRNVAPSISTATWRNAVSPKDGNVLGSDW